MINKPSNWNEFEESEVVSNVGLAAGAYPVQIKNVLDIAEKEYLEIRFDIVKDKNYAGYFAKLKENLQLDANAWPNQGIYRASYKETATKFFKAFITAVQKSNQGYVWNWDYHTLIGKYLVMNFGEEEYKYNGEIRISVKAKEPRSIEAWKNGEIKPLQLKKLKIQEQKIETPVTVIDENDLPF